MAENVYSCVECGALFNSPETLFKHIKRCNEQEIKTCSDTDSESESVWDDMVQEVYDANDATYQEKVQKPRICLQTRFAKVVAQNICVFPPAGKE